MAMFGMVTKYIPDLLIKDINNAAVIVVGPPTYDEFTVAEFLKRGIDENNIWISQERKMCCGIGSVDTVK
ncbi:hypothetical protein B0H37_001442 [Clostridium beijerinckii]|nr:hypothetical protein [Clostridium beijerinckii]